MAPTDDMRAQGYRGTSRCRLYGITPEDFRGFDWVDGVRAHTILIDALGNERPLGSGK
jgi:hypothetical protein